MMFQIDFIMFEWVVVGVGDIIIIYGENFGEGMGIIFFWDVDWGGQGYIVVFLWYIVFWIIIVIEIKVFYKVGFGIFLIFMSFGGIGFSLFFVNIIYVYNNVMSFGVFYEFKFIDYNSWDDGGYLFIFSNNMNYNGVFLVEVEGVIEVFNVVVGVWQDLIGLLIYIGDDCLMVFVMVNGSFNDGQNIISFDYDEWDIWEQLGEQVFVVIIFCYVCCGDFEWEFIDVDMVIWWGVYYNEIDDVVWFFSGIFVVDELDFQLVVLYELGYVFQL